MPTFDLWDLQTALASVDGQKDDLSDLMRIWLRQAPQLMGELRTGIETTDVTLLNRTAHTLRGSLEILGAERICNVAKRLETMQESNIATEGPVAEAELQELVTGLVQDVTEFLNNGLSE